MISGQPRPGKNASKDELMWFLVSVFA